MINVALWVVSKHHKCCQYSGAPSQKQIFRVEQQKPRKNNVMFFFREVFEKWFASIFQDAVLPCFSLQVWHEPDAVELSTAIPTTVHSRWREWRCLTNGFDVLKFRPCRFPGLHSWNKSDSYFWAVFCCPKNWWKGWDFNALTNYIFPKDSPPLPGSLHVGPKGVRFTTFKEAISRCLQMLSLRSWFHPIFWYVFVLCRAQHSLKSFKQLSNHHFELEVKYTFQQAEPFKTENLIFHLSTCRKTSSFQVMQQKHLPSILVVQNNEKKKEFQPKNRGKFRSSQIHREKTLFELWISVLKCRFQTPSAFLPAVDRCKRCVRWEVDEIFMQTTCKKQDLRCQIFHLFSSVDFFRLIFVSRFWFYSGYLFNGRILTLKIFSRYCWMWRRCHLKTP